MNTVHEDIFVNVKEPEFTVLTDPAEAGVLVTQQTVAHIRSPGVAGIE
jgi:hypothetical protein